MQKQPIHIQLSKQVNLSMLRIEGGSFTQGSTDYDDEQPLREVKLDDFYLGQFPVTNQQYLVFLQDYGSDSVLSGPFAKEKIIYNYDWGITKKEAAWTIKKGFENHPVIGVTWYGAHTFCEWLSQKTGKQFYLPSESQWEYAARGGQLSQGFKYAGSHRLEEVGWYRDNSHEETKPVGLKLSNELGLYDMSGNVWEWCADHWHDNYDKAPLDGSAWIVDGEESTRMVRGGSWVISDGDCRVSVRSGYYASSRYDNIGFRLAGY